MENMETETALSRRRERAVRMRLWVCERLSRLRPFWTAFFITLCLFGLLAGWTAVGLRCRMAADPPETQAAVFYARDGYLKVRFLDFSAELKVIFDNGYFKS